MTDYNLLLTKAKEASSNAYAKYSDFKVGACVLFESGEIYTGCNVENASYGLSLCAERNAISTAIANGEKSKIKAVAIFSPNSALCSPCGACRQWIYELKSDNTQIILADKNSKPIIYTIEELLPHGFML
ncbi:cytidine deaminase [bacterium]|nr:cytidine deaminase [bacterium]